MAEENPHSPIWFDYTHCVGWLHGGHENFEKIREIFAEMERAWKDQQKGEEERKKWRKKERREENGENTQ